MSKWIEVRAIFGEAPIDWSPAIEVFGRYGCSETLQEDNPPTLVSSFENVPGVGGRIAALREALSDLGVERLEAQEIPDQDWAEIWKQFFKVRRIARVVIKPSWEEYAVQEGEVVVDLDPGQAFGTGDHPTTRLCLSLMQQLDLEGLRIADVGCGSGILAIAAAKLGASRVVASDIDEQSVEIARENARRNEVSFPVLAEPDLNNLGDGFDLVLSNIITATLVRLAPDVYQCLAPTGTWIASGIIRANWESLRQAAEGLGFRLEQMEEEDEWVGATFRR